MLAASGAPSSPLLEVGAGDALDEQPVTGREQAAVDEVGRHPGGVARRVDGLDGSVADLELISVLGRGQLVRVRDAPVDGGLGMTPSTPSSSSARTPEMWSAWMWVSSAYFRSTPRSSASLR